MATCRIALLAGALALVSIACGELMDFGDSPNGNGDDNGDGFGISGLSVVAELPVGVDGTTFGRHAVVATTSDGPIAAFTWNKGDEESIHFSRWDGDGWTDFVEVDSMGSVNQNQPYRQVSIAYDSSLGVVGIAYAAGQHEMKLALSDDYGDTWTKEVLNRVDSERPREVANPVLVMADGVVHLAYWQAWQRGTSSQADGVWYLRRGPNDSEFQATMTPLLSGTRDNLRRPMGLALDSEGKPGLAYFLRSDSEVQHRDNVSLAFWRPVADEVTLIVESEDNRYDNASVSLGFDGLLPFVSFHHRIGSKPNFLFVMKYSETDGWGRPIEPPLDGNDRTSAYQSGAVAPDGTVAVAAVVSQITGGDRGDWGSPKVHISKDLQSWQITSPVKEASVTRGPRHVSVAFDEHNSLHLVFQNESMDSAPLGVVHWSLDLPEDE